MISTYNVYRTVVGAAALGVLLCAMSLHAQPDHWQTLVDAGNAALRKNQFITAGKALRQALNEAERSGLTDPRVGKSFKLLGDFYFAQQKYDEARKYYARAEALGNALRNLHTAEQGLQAGAFPYSKQAAEMALHEVEAKAGRQSILVTPCLIALAKAEKGLLEVDEAERSLARAVRILERSGKEGVELASALSLLGAVYEGQGKHAEAGPLFERALAIRKKILAPDDPKLAESYTQLSEYYRVADRAAEAEDLLQQAAAIRERGLLHLKEYADEGNGFRFQVPGDWITSSMLGMQVPGALVGFQSPDSLSGVLVQRFPFPAGSDPSAVFDTMGRGAEITGKGETIGEENVTLSGLPARRVFVDMPLGKNRLRDWETFLVALHQIWVFHVIGPEPAMDSSETFEYRRAQRIADSFAFQDAVLTVLKAQVIAPPPPAKTIVVDQEKRRWYANREVGIRILLPDGWKETTQNSPSFQEGTTVVLSKTGTLAFVILTREYLEASPELYLKVLTGGMVTATENFHELSRKTVTQAGLEGTRLALITTESGVEYRSVVEVFSSGKQHYRVMARAPTEVYDRYAETLTQMLDSVQFLPLGTQPSTGGGSPDRPSNDPQP